uniref:ABC transporter ATP-binding protein n=2 Tax=Flavobacterium sp. TaxID=239 RepID=UPI00404B8FA7
METILNIRNLHKKYKNVHAVNDVTFSIKKGHVYGILGPNGSGKSTTLGIVLNVVNRTSGDFEWFEGKLSETDSLKKVGAIIERPNFYPYMSAYQNLKLVCKIKEIPLERIDEKLELVGLLDRKNSDFKTFSLGMKQRLAIASALLNNPEILILDEPTNGLDPQGIRQIRDLILEIAKTGTTILLASHLLDEVEKVCSHVVVLQLGRMLYCGSVEEMVNSKTFFDLKSKDLVQLKSLMQQHPNFDNLNENDGKLTVFFNEEIEPETLNEYCIKNQIMLGLLVPKKHSLEEQFLALTKGKNENTAV